MKIKPAVFTIDLTSDVNKRHEFNDSSSTLECKSIGSSGDSIDSEDKVIKGSDSISISTDEPSNEISIDKHSHSGSGHHAPLSTCSALVYLIKANLGAGLFAIPAAFKNAGLVGGSIGIPIMALLSIHCMHMLIKCSSVMKQRKGDKEISMDYPEVLETACLTGPESMVKYATYARQFVRMKLFMKNLIFCSVFLLFAGTYLHQLMSYYFKDVEDWSLKHWGVRHWTAILIIIAIPLACVRQYKYLYPLSYVASAIKGLSLIVLFYFILQDLPSTTERPNFSTWKYALLFYGTIIFAFEGITQALPLHDNMRTTRHFRAPTGVLNTGMIVISCLYFGVGFYGYLKYGDYTYPSITMNLPKDKIAAQVVKIGLIISLMIAYGLSFFAAVDMIQPSISRYCSTKWKRGATEAAVRIFLFFGSLGLAMITINLDLFISLAGAFGCTFLCLTFPPLLDTITFWDKMGKIRLTKNMIIIIFSILAWATGTVASIFEGVIGLYSNHETDCYDKATDSC